MVKIGILTGGGDCPGINAVIRGAVKTALLNNWKVLGLLNGWKGLLNKECRDLDARSVDGIFDKGGTILGTSRTNPYKIEAGTENCKKNFSRLGLDSLVAIGGEDTLSVASKLYKEGLNIVGVPKTIDNDLSATDVTFGFDTTINTAMDAVDRLRTTAESHHRVMVVEVMGRHAGWIALYSGIACGADVILVPEVPIDMDEVVAILKNNKKKGKNYGIVVVAEGATMKDKTMLLQEEKLDAFGHVRLGGIGQALGKKIEELTGQETRVTVLGHVLRGGQPTASDRVLGARFGVAAVRLAEKKKFGRMVSLSGNEIIDVPLEKAVGKIKTVDKDFYNLARIFFG